MKRLFALFLLFVICIALPLFGVGCGAEPSVPIEKDIDSILITRTNALFTPTEVKAEITDQAQIEALISVLENVSYRNQKNPYDTPEAKTVLGSEIITLRCGEETVAEYRMHGCLYIRDSETGPWHILSNDCWQEMWTVINKLAPFDDEFPPYGISLPGTPCEITSIRIVSVLQPEEIVYLNEAAEVKAFCDLMHSLEFCAPDDAQEAAPFYDGGGWVYAAFYSGGTIVEEYYVYGKFVSPTVAGPSSIMTEESYKEMQKLLASLNIAQ